MTGFYKEYDDTSGAYVSSAEDAAAAALVSENAAAASATAAAASEVLAAEHETATSTSETNAATSETNAATSATNAATSETNASGSATAAAGSATSASTEAGTATTKASEASTSATNAATSETNAASSATNAATSETNAATSATNAASSATTASTQATNASSSATAAATSETNAGNSATAAATSETNAASSATSASGSATTATTKAGEASTSATNAATSETNAATSATNSANSATSAGTAQTAAEAARDAALAAFDSFDDRYLGPKASDPTTDNDGDALAAGMLYFNTTTDDMKVYEGSSWVNAYSSLSGALIATNNLSDLNNAATSRTNLGLGTAATTASTDYATAAQADQTVALTGAGTTTISGTYPNFTITGAGTTYTAGTGMTLTGTEFSIGQGVATTDSPAFAGLTVDTTTLAVDSTNNRVGIGTTSPSEELHLSKSASGADVCARIQNSAVSSGDTATLRFSVTSNSSFDSAFVGSDRNNALILGSNAAERMRIDSSGQVGIGTSSPSSYGGKLNITDAAVGGESTLVIANNNANQFVRVGINDNVAQIAYDNADSLAFGEATDSTTSGLTTERMRIDSSGNVGIGTSSPLSATNYTALTVQNNTYGGIVQVKDDTVDLRLQIQADATGRVGTHSNHPLRFDVNGSERMRIDSSGNVGIGTSSPSKPLEITDATADGTGGVKISSYLPTLEMDDISGGGTSFILQQDGANTLFKHDSTERMRIDGSGKVGIGTTSPSKDLHVVGQCLVEDSQEYGNEVSRITLTGGSYGVGLKVQNSSLGGTGTTALFSTTSTAKNVSFANGGVTSIFATFNKYNSSAAGHIRMTNNVLQYQVLSDARAKENIVDAGDAGSKIDAIQVRQFDWIDGGLHEEFGFIAQELAPIVPLAVGGEPDDEEMMGVDASKLVPLLVKEIQSLRARVAALEE